MAQYKPNLPFMTPLYLFNPTTVTAKGSTKKVYPETGELIYCSFKTYGGTEKEVNGVIVFEATANIETKYRPDIKTDSILQTQDGTRYEIINDPENINMRYQFLKFKVRAIKGGA